MVDAAKKPPAEPTEEELWNEFEKAEAKPDDTKDHEFAETGEGANNAPAGEAAGQPPRQQEEAPDIWATAPPELRAAHDAQVRALETATTDHARRSIEGRIASYTRRLNERNAAAAQQPPAATEEAADPLAEMAAEYPEIATPLQQKLAPITEKLSQFDAQLKSRQAAADQEMDANLQVNERLLEDKHPGWAGFLRENGPAFGTWIVDQPLRTREAFVTNKDAIVDPYSAIETLDAFKNFVAANQPSQQQPSGAPAAQTQRLNSRRTAQLASSASPRSVGSRPTVSGIPEDGDPQAIWDSFAAVDPDEKKWRSA